MPNMPDLLTGPVDDPDGVTLALPDNSSVPPPEVPGLDLSRGIAAAVEGTHQASTQQNKYGSLLNIHEQSMAPCSAHSHLVSGGARRH